MAKAHFRILGIPIRVEPLFVVVAALFGIRLEPLWMVLGWMAIVFVSVLVHELGHAVTYRFLGQRSAIVLHGFGGFTVPTGGGRRVLSKPKSVFVSISGEAVAERTMSLMFDDGRTRRVSAQYIVGCAASRLDR